MKNKKIIQYGFYLLLAIATVSCKKDYLETAPSDQAPTELVFATTQGAYTALNGVYRAHWMLYGDAGIDANFAQKACDMTADLMGNDVTIHTYGYGWFTPEYQYTAQASVTATGRPYFVWSYYYFLISSANNIIANIDAAAGPQEDKDNIKGQALAVRANSYFNLVNFFQHTYKGNENKPGVPLYTAPTTEGGPRGTVQQVYTQIISDLTQAETLLTGKIRQHMSHINVNTTQGIRARVALQMEDYPTAAAYANKARQGYTLMSTAQYQGGFSSVSNPEWIWGMQINNEQSTTLFSFWSHIDASVYGYAQAGNMQKKITRQLYDQIPAGDVRKTVFRAPGTGTSTNPDYNQNKFRVPDPSTFDGDYVFMRAGEMYLIEAEALARQGAGQEAAAKTVLEAMVKARYPAYTTTGLTGAALITEILLQRRIELWGEGFSLLDIKRLKTGLNRPTGAGNHGGTNFNPNVTTLPDQDPKFLMKIPQSEIDANDAMTIADQNP
ncbi:MAG: RagB/SusD family nutrient uptake outer membrane protein [Chitinophagaceae bacterium]